VRSRPSWRRSLSACGRHAAAGDLADYPGPSDAENDPNHADTWGASRTLRAAVIRWLRVDRAAVRHLDPGGIRLCRAKIDGELDLRGVIIPCPLLLERCALRHDVRLNFAETHLLSFAGSVSGSISGDGLMVKGELWLRQGFRATGAVALRNATITGNWDCDGGTFLNPDGDALDAGGITVHGRVFLHQGFHAEGKVRLVGATISGALVCEAGVFHNPGKIALDASQAYIGGSASLSRDFQAEGEVRLVGTTISGDLDCQGGMFLNPHGDALIAGGITVRGRAFLHQGFQAEGAVLLIGATISGDLDCHEGVFHNPGKIALQADGITVKGRTFLRQGFQADGAVSLISATIAVNLDCGGGVFLNANGNALDASWAHVDGPVFLHQGFHAEGEVALVGATVAGFLNCDNGTFHNPGKAALLATGIKIGSVALLRNRTRSDKGFRAEGAVSLVTATIAGDLDCTGGTFHNPDKIALDASGIHIGGRTFLRQGFHAEGEVRLVTATIASDLDCTGGELSNPGKAALQAYRVNIDGSVFLCNNFRANGWVRLGGGNIGGDLNFYEAQSGEMLFDLAGAKVSRLIDDRDSWLKLREFELDGFVYTTLADSPTDAKSRLDWLEQQPHKPFRPQPYQQLAKALRERGQEADAKRVLIAKERARRKRGNLGRAAWCWNGFLGLTMAHGYRPQQLLLGAVGFVLLGGWLFGGGYQAGTIIRAKAVEAATPYPTFNRWMYSLDTLVPIINFGQKDYWRPRDPEAISSVPQPSRLALAGEATSLPAARPAAWVISSRFLRTYRWIYIGVGWLLITLGVAGVTGLVRKE
jgi:hypothetical protein